MSIQQKVSSIPLNIDNNPDFKRMQVAAQSTRLQILNLLLQNKKMYPTQLEKELGIQRRVVSFHLSALEEVELVKSKYGLSDDDKRPQAVRYYSITEHGKDIYKRILSMFEK
jgi:DNA-binding transcriptional ArsR family regulator